MEAVQAAFLGLNERPEPPRPLKRDATETQLSYGLEIFGEAIRHQSRGELAQARELYEQLVDLSFVRRLQSDQSPAGDEDSPSTGPRHDGRLLVHSVYRSYGALLDALGDHEAARDMRERALHIDPNHAALWNELGNVASATEAYLDASRAYENCIRQSTMMRHKLIALEGLVAATEKLGDVESALQYASERLVLDPKWHAGNELASNVVELPVAHHPLGFRGFHSSGALPDPSLGPANSDHTRMTPIATDVSMQTQALGDASFAALGRLLAQLSRAELDSPHDELEDERVSFIRPLRVTLEVMEKASFEGSEVRRTVDPFPSPSRKRKAANDSDTGDGEDCPPLLVAPPSQLDRIDGEGENSHDGTAEQHAAEDRDVTDDRPRRSLRGARRQEDAQDEDATLLSKRPLGSETVFDGTSEAKLIALMDQVLPASFHDCLAHLEGGPPDNLVAQHMERIMDISHGGWRRRFKKRKPDSEAEAGVGRFLGSVKAQFAGEAASFLTDSSAVLDFVEACDGLPLAAWIDRFVNDCCFAAHSPDCGRSRWLATPFPPSLVSVICELLLTSDICGVGFQRYATRVLCKPCEEPQTPIGVVRSDCQQSDPLTVISQRLVTAAEIVLDQFVDQCMERGTGHMDDNHCKTLGSYLGIVGSILGDAAAVETKIRFYWLLGRYKLVEGLADEADVAFEKCANFCQRLGEAVVLANARWDGVISSDAVAEKLRAIKARRFVEMISATFKAGDYQVVFGALEPLLIREAATLPASVDADAEVSRESILGLPASDSVLLLELMMKSAEAANKPPHIVSEIGAKEFEALVLHLAASSSTLDVLEKLDSLLHRLKLAWQRGDPSHWGRASITAFFRATFQATMLAHEMLVRWSEFVPLAQRPSPERERLRNLCHLFVVRTMQLVTQAGLYHRGSNSHEVAEFLLFTHQLLGARDLCGADNGSFLEQCREIFSNAGPSYKHAKIQIYNCLYDVVLDPEVPFQRHATQARSLDKHVSEIALAIAPRWASNLQRDRPNERVRHTMSATLDRLISAVGDHWERNGHVQRNRNLLERVLSSDCKIEPASARHSFPWHDASTLAAACDSIPAACFHVFYLKGTLMFPQYDATKSQYTEHAVVLEDVVLPCFLKNLELNCDSLEAWWCLGLCYAHLAWNALGQESGSVLRSRRKDVASWQRRAFHCLTHALYGIKDSPQALIFRAPSFPFHPKSSSAASDLLSSLGCLIMSMICSPMEGLALQPACTSVMPCADQQEEDVQGISLAKEETLRQRFLTFAVALLRQCASRQREEWQLPYMIAQSLRKLDAAPALILGFFREGLALQPPMTLTRGKAPLLDCRLEILSYLGKDSDRGRISKAEALSAITALPGEHAHVDDSQPSLVNVVLQELYQLKRLDPEGWHVKIPYNIAWLQWHKLADPEAAKATLNSIFGANHRLKVWKSGAARPGDVLATRQAIYALLLDVLQGANDMDGIRSLLSRIGRDRSSKDLFMEETTDPDSIWRTAFAAVFEHVRAQDVLGKELVPVNPGMSTALGAKLSRAEFDRLAPRVEDRMLVLARRSGQDLASRRLNLLQKLEELRKWRDAWQWGRSVLIVDTDEDSDLERMAVGIYGWLWRTAIVDGEMSVFSNDGSGQAKEEQRTNDPKLRFKHVSRRVQLFVRGLPHARTIAPSKDKQDQDAAQGPLSSGDGPREPSMFGVTPSHGPRSPTAAL